MAVIKGLTKHFIVEKRTCENSTLDINISNTVLLRKQVDIHTLWLVDIRPINLERTQGEV